MNVQAYRRGKSINIITPNTIINIANVERLRLCLDLIILC